MSYRLNLKNTIAPSFALHSCLIRVWNVTNIHESFLESIASGKNLCAVFLDLSKAFDTRHWTITAQMQSITITITNIQDYNVTDYDYIESNHDYNRDYIGLETSSEQKQTPFAWFDASIFSDNIRY